MFKKKPNTKFILLIVQFNNCRHFLATRIAPANEELSLEYKNRICLITLIGSAGRFPGLNSIFNQKTLTMHSVLLIKQLEGLKSNINARSKTNFKFFVHRIE